MKAYLITTGILFGLIAFMHLLRSIAERSLLATRPLEFLSMAALGVLSAAFSLWAWRLLHHQVRQSSDSTILNQPRR